MPEAIDLSIIIVNWNSKEFVRQCIGSIRRQTSGLSYEIVVVDNASFDGCDQVLRESEPSVIYVQSDKNAGFARANNLGFESSRGASLLFLNPDTEIAGPAIVRLHEALHRLPDAGAVGAKLLNGDGSLQRSCIQAYPTIVNQMLDSDFLQKRWPNSDLWKAGALHRAGGTPEAVEVISGACVMTRREVFERIGRFSEDYFMYAEDADLCYKVNLAGLKNYYVPAATVVHFGGTSSRQAVSNFSAVMMRESIWRFLCKNRGGYYAIGYRVSVLFVALWRLAGLAVCIPIQKLRRGQGTGIAAFRKWRAILRWSMGRESWAGRYLKTGGDCGLRKLSSLQV